MSYYYRKINRNLTQFKILTNLQNILSLSFYNLVHASLNIENVYRDSRIVKNKTKTCTKIICFRFELYSINLNVWSRTKSVMQVIHLFYFSMPPFWSYLVFVKHTSQFGIHCFGSYFSLWRFCYLYYTYNL